MVPWAGGRGVIVRSTLVDKFRVLLADGFKYVLLFSRRIFVCTVLEMRRVFCGCEYQNTEGKMYINCFGPACRPGPIVKLFSGPPGTRSARLHLHFHEFPFAFFHAFPSSFLGRDINIYGNTKPYPTNTPELDPLTRGSPSPHKSR